MKYKKQVSQYVSMSVVLASFAVLTFAVPALADNTISATVTGQGQWQGHMHGVPGMNRGGMKPGVFGTVSAVSGNTLTVAGKTGFGTNATSVTYTVDATNAKVMKAGATSTVSAIAIGDMVIVQGTVSGTNVTATMIRDGVMRKMQGEGNNENNQGQNGSAPTVTGNGEPVVGGKVTTVSGSTLTITNNSNVTYTVDATNAKVSGGPSVTSISNVSVGDSVLVQGTVSGNSVTASSLIDQKAPTSTTGTTGKSQSKGFFGSIGSFFSHIFGF